LEDLDTDAESFRAALVKSLTTSERAFYTRYPMVWWISLMGPAVFTLLVLVFIGVISGLAVVRKYVVSAFLAFFIFGRFSIPGATIIGTGITSEETCFMLIYMDLMVALFVSFHMGLMFRIPWVGPKLGALVYDGKYILDSHRWIKRFAFLGLIGLVVFPSTATGSIGGSIFGRLLGLGRSLTLFGIAIGTFIGNGIMYFFATQLEPYLDPTSTPMRIGGLAIIVAFIVLIEFRYRQLKKRYAAARTTNQPKQS
jgi:uncharacterized membrane protein